MAAVLEGERGQDRVGLAVRARREHQPLVLPFHRAEIEAAAPWASRIVPGGNLASTKFLHDTPVRTSTRQARRALAMRDAVQDHRDTEARGGAAAACCCPAAVAAAVTLLAAGAAAINETAARWLLHADAEATARAWAADLSEQLGPELRALLAAPPTLAGGEEHPDQARRIGGVFRYELFDASGARVFVSDDLADPAGPAARWRRYRGAQR